MSYYGRANRFIPEDRSEPVKLSSSPSSGRDLFFPGDSKSATSRESVQAAAARFPWDNASLRVHTSARPFTEEQLPLAPSLPAPAKVFAPAPVRPIRTDSVPKPGISAGQISEASQREINTARGLSNRLPQKSQRLDESYLSPYNDPWTLSDRLSDDYRSTASPSHPGYNAALAAGISRLAGPVSPFLMLETVGGKKFEKWAPHLPIAALTTHMNAAVEIDGVKFGDPIVAASGGVVVPSLPEKYSMANTVPSVRIRFDNGDILTVYGVSNLDVGTQLAPGAQIGNIKTAGFAAVVYEPKGQQPSAELTAQFLASLPHLFTRTPPAIIQKLVNEIPRNRAMPANFANYTRSS